MRQEPSREEPHMPDSGTGRVFVLRNQKLLLDTSSAFPQVPGREVISLLRLDPADGYRLDGGDGSRSFAFSVSKDTDPPSGMEFFGLRKIFGILDPAMYVLAVRSLGILNWDRTCRFCSVCGSPLHRGAAILSKECDACGHTMFPKISPAVIVLVEKDGMALLARASRFAENLYSVLAGFAEPGESLEDCVRREIGEEVGIKVKNIRYFGSQPWPYPDSLMIGFTAEWAGGEIVIDDDEISDARWFTADDLPAIPDKVSIARALIDWYVEKQVVRDR